jgi:glycosyltransferase involved in cell wall biosynthesis
MSLISIIIPFYNAKKHLKKNFQSCLKLLKLPIEIIYVNDGSNDNSNEILKKKIYSLNLNKKKISLINLSSNKGPGVARNHALKKCNGKYVIFLDIDDEIIAHNLRKFIDNKNIYFKKTDIFFVDYKRTKYTEPNLVNLSKINLSKSRLIKKFLRRDFIDYNPNFYIFNKKFLIRNKIFFSSGFYEDIYFMLRCFFFMKNKKKFTKKIYNKFKTIGSITNTHTKKHLISFMKTSKQKYNFYFEFLDKSKLSNLNKKDLQYGLRADFVSAIKMSNKINTNYKIKNIVDFYKKILNLDFTPKTAYDIEAFKYLNEPKL